jgi:hypothetical protein
MHEERPNPRRIPARIQHGILGAARQVAAEK